MSTYTPYPQPEPPAPPSPEPRRSGATKPIMIIIAVGISARRERKAAAEAGPRSSGDSEYVVIDKAALDAGAKVSQPGSRYGRNRFSSPGVHGRAEAEEDAVFEERFRPR